MITVALLAVPTTRTLRGLEASAQEKPSLASVPVTGYAIVSVLEVLDESK